MWIFLWLLFLDLRGLSGLSVRVSDPAGRPVEGAEIWIVPHGFRDGSEGRDWDAYYRQGPAAVTGPEGRAELPGLPPGRSASLDVCRPGYLPAEIEVREIPGEGVEAVLVPAARISGRVVDPPGGPVVGARVVGWLSGEIPERPESIRPCLRHLGAVRTDGEGRFTLEPLPPGWWNVQAKARGWLDAKAERRQVRIGERLEGLELVLGEGAVVTGRVYSPNGATLAGARVRVDDGPEVRSGKDGGYRVEGVALCERTVEATHPAYEVASRRLEVGAGENRLDLALEPDRRREIRGRVLGPDGASLAGARVASSSSAASSAADGSFTLREKDGRHEVWAQAEGYAPAQADVAVEGGPVDGVEIRLARGGVLRGRLLGLDRDGLAGATVETTLLPRIQRRSSVEPSGGYRIAGLPPGIWEVTARAGGRTVTGRVELAPDAGEAVLDLDFPRVFEVSGQVLDAGGQPVAAAAVRLFSGGRDGIGDWAYTRPDGSFRLEAEEGDYRGFAMKAGYVSAELDEPVRVDGGAVRGLELVLGRGTVLRGRILGLEPGARAGEVRAEGPDGVVRLGDVDQEAQYAIFGLVPGEWKVTASFEGRRAAARITVEEGEDEAFLELPFPSIDDDPGQQP
jgi:protocatechuate 3,4-dioxygenase beta subunit